MVALLRGGCWRGAGAAGISTGTAAKSTAGSSVATGAPGRGFTPDPSRSVCGSVRPLACPLLPAFPMTQRRRAALLQHPGLFPNFSQPGGLKSELILLYNTPLYFCRLFFFFFFLPCGWKQPHGSTVSCVLVMTHEPSQQ